MRVRTIEELMQLTRIELTGLLVRIKSALPDCPEGSAPDSLPILRKV